MLSMIFFMASCNVEKQLQDGWAQRYSSRDHGLSFTYLDDWTMVRESYRDGVVSLQLEKVIDEAKARLVVTVLPYLMVGDELFTEVTRMLETGLYNIEFLREENEVTSETEVIVIDAIAGEKDKLFIRTACFPLAGRTYFFTILIREDNSAIALDELEKILAAVEQE